MSGFPYHQPQVLLPNGSCYLYFNTFDALPEVTNTIDTVADKKRKLRDVTCLSSEQSEGTEVHYQRESLLMDPKKGKVRKQKKATEETKLSSEPPSGYIHVRARRGLATDSHSLAERVRREKISQRMKLLQDLVPGCDKVTGKAGLLDEIINYVQTLQHQVEFLSMKLALVNPALHGLDEGLRANEEQQQQNPWSMSVPSVLQTSPIQQATPNVATGSHSMMDYHSQLLLQGQVSMENGTYIIQVADQSEEPPIEQVLNDIIFSELN